MGPHARRVPLDAARCMARAARRCSLVARGRAAACTAPAHQQLALQLKKLAGCVPCEIEPAKRVAVLYQRRSEHALHGLARVCEDVPGGRAGRKAGQRRVCC